MAKTNIHFDIDWQSLRKVLMEYGEYFIQQARNDLGNNHSYASGKLGDTMKTDVQIYDDHYEVNIILQDYWEYVDNGRKPGKFPPPNKIKKWIQIKPVPRGKLPTVDQLAFLIGRKIATKGIDPAPFFKKNIRPTYEHFKEAIALAIDEDVARWIETEVLQKAIYEDLFDVL